jgi:hypothetical protein
MKVMEIKNGLENRKNFRNGKPSIWQNKNNGKAKTI